VHAQVEAFDLLIVDLDAQVVDGDDGGFGHGRIITSSYSMMT
jgi:hypothetical protein